MNQALPRRLLLLALPAVVAVMFLLMTTPTKPADAALNCADLIITDVVVTPTSPVEDINANIAVTVKNQGSCAAIGFVVQWKQSQLSPTGPSTSVGSLGIGASTTLNFTYAFPNDGNFLTSARVDTGNAVTESIENNNLFIKSVTVLGPESDLIITDVFFTPDPAVATEAMTATVRVENVGNTATGQFRVQWKPSPLGTAQSQQVNSLGIGASIDVVFPYTYAIAGTYNTSARADVLNSVQETNEFNNTFNATLVVDPPRPDLDIVDVSISPANPTAGLPAQLTVEVENIGHAPAGDFQVQWKPSLLALALTQQVNGPLNPGDSAFIVFDYTYAVGGTFNGTITADSASRILEVSESNNTEDFPVTVSSSSVDLTITAFGYTPPNPVQGENVQFSVTIENLGTSPATNFEVSANPDAFQIATPSMQTLTTQVSNLDPGASTTLFFDFEYPHAGNFRGIAEVDAFHNIFETNEANNKALADLVVAPGSIDLDITDFTLSTDLCAEAVGHGNACSPMLYFKGSAVTASVTVTNNGTFPAGTFFVKWQPDQTKPGGPTVSVPGLLPGASTTVFLTSSFSSDGPFTSLATVDFFDQVVEPCGGCETNNTDTESISVLPRDTTISMQITQFRIDDMDDGLNAETEWAGWFLALDPTASCNVSFSVIDETLDGARCVSFSGQDNEGGQQGSQGGALVVTLPESLPLVIAAAVLDDDLPAGAPFIGYDYEAFLPGDYQGVSSVTFVAQGDTTDECSEPCWDATITFTITMAAPPPASVSLP